MESSGEIDFEKSHNNHAAIALCCELKKQFLPTVITLLLTRTET